MGRRILAILTAAVIALVGAVLVLVYARGADARAVAAASPTKVYVSNTAISAGTSLKDAVRLGQLVQTDVAARAKPVGALEKVDENNSDLVALTDLTPGQYVLAAAFGDTPVGEKALQVGAGKLAVSVQLQDPARVGTFVHPRLLPHDLHDLQHVGDQQEPRTAPRTRRPSAPVPRSCSTTPR